MASAALTGTFPGFTLRTHAAVRGISDISHTLHSLWTGVGFTHVVQLGTSVTWRKKSKKKAKKKHKCYITAFDMRERMCAPGVTVPSH